MINTKLLTLLFITPFCSYPMKQKGAFSSSQARAKALCIVIPAQNSEESAEESPGSTERSRNSAGSPLCLAPGSPLARVKGLITPRRKSKNCIISYSGDSDSKTEPGSPKHRLSSAETLKAPIKPAPKLTDQQLIEYFGKDFWDDGLPPLSPDSPHGISEQSRDDSDSLEAMIATAMKSPKNTDN